MWNNDGDWIKIEVNFIMKDKIAEYYLYRKKYNSE